MTVCALHQATPSPITVALMEMEAESRVYFPRFHLAILASFTGLVALISFPDAFHRDYTCCNYNTGE